MWHDACVREPGSVMGPTEGGGGDWLQARGVLVHVGPPKTGTTALQHALALARPRLLELGVTYPGRRPSHWHASCAVLGLPATGHPADPPVPLRRWERLVRQIGRRADRAVVSSEGFADADQDQIGRIVRELGGSDVRILVTARNLADVLPSTWQQDLKSGAPVPLPGALARLKSRVVRPYDDWISDVLSDRKGESLFWRRSDYARLVQRWADVVGPDRVMVLVVRSERPEQILRDAEMLVGLPDGVLQLVGRTNRSLSREESEFVRGWLLRLEREQLLSSTRYHNWVRRGGLANLVEDRLPGPGETRLVTPAWARDPLQRRTEAILAGLRASGCGITGDLAALNVGSGPVTESTAPTWIPDDAAVALVMGVLRAAVAEQPTPASEPSQARQLRATLAARLIRRRP